MVFWLHFDQIKEAVTTNKCTSVAGYFDSHCGAMVQYCEYRLMKVVQGFYKSH